MPLTFPKNLDQLPPYEDYSMQGRTYRYMTEEPMYPFGFGLSYASFEYSDIVLSFDAIKKGESVSVKCKVTNTSEIAADEVVQMYIQIENKKVRSPLYSLKGVQRIHLKPGESREIDFEINPEMLQLVDENGKWISVKGNAKVFISGSLPSDRSTQLGATASNHVTLRLK